MPQSREKRLQKLENDRYLERRPPPSASEILFFEKLNELLASMDPEHARMVSENLRLPPKQWSDLVMRVTHRLDDHLERSKPLAFPAEVVEVYLRDPRALDIGKCKD